MQDLLSGLLSPGLGLSRHIRGFVHVLRNIVYGGCQLLSLIHILYVVTLSALLSGSHNSAEQARLLMEEDEPQVNVHVFNSCSASPGEVLVALKIKELASAGLPFKHVVREVEQFIYKLQTLFVLESLENLRKNGRLTKLQAVVTGALKIKLVMAATRCV